MWCLALLRQTWSIRPAPIPRVRTSHAGGRRPVGVLDAPGAAWPWTASRQDPVRRYPPDVPTPTAPSITPDGRYLVVRGRLWRLSNPALPAEVREQLVHGLMQARRAVRAALVAGDADALRRARADVQAAKVGLGERGPVWWDDGAPDWNRHLAKNTPYAAWSAAQGSA